MNIIGNTIKELRTQANLSLQGLASQVDVSKAAIQQYENGTVTPSNIVLKRIASVLGAMFWDFFRAPEFDLNIDSIKFRDGNKLHDITVEEDEIKKDVIGVIKNYLELEAILENKLHFENPLADFKISNFKDVERAVKRVRKKWKLGYAPIDSVCDLLEEKGVKIITVNRHTNSGGLSGWVNDIPIIVINDFFEHTRETTRKRFTLIHELGHLLMKSSIMDEEKEEMYCNQFAAAFLIVDEVVYEKIGKNRTSISFGELKQLKETYGLSIKAIIFRLNNLQLLDDHSKNKIIEDYENWETNSEDYGSYTKSEEKPRRFHELLRKALAEDKIEKYKAFELSGIPVDKLNELTIKNYQLKYF